MNRSLEVRDLDVDIRGEGAFPVVSDMGLSVAPGETLCIVGESGLRQVDDGAVAASAPARGGDDRARRDHRSMARTCLAMDQRRWKICAAIGSP